MKIYFYIYNIFKTTIGKTSLSSPHYRLRVKSNRLIYLPQRRSLLAYWLSSQSSHVITISSVRQQHSLSNQAKPGMGGNPKVISVSVFEPKFKFQNFRIQKIKHQARVSVVSWGERENG